MDSYALLRQLVRKEALSYSDNKEAATPLLAKGICRREGGHLLLDPLSVVFVGLDVTASSFSYVITDLCGRKLFGRYCSMVERSLSKQIELAIVYSLLEAKKEGYVPLACGVSCPGTVDASGLKIRSYRAAKETTLPQRVLRYSGTVVRVIPDIHCLLWSEIAVDVPQGPLRALLLQKDPPKRLIVTATWDAATFSPVAHHAESQLDELLRALEGSPHVLYAVEDIDTRGLRQARYGHSALAMGAARHCELVTLDEVYSPQAPEIAAAFRESLRLS